MSTATYGAHTVDVDYEGYLLRPGDWNPEIAQALASQSGITLGPEHWKVIEFVRKDAQERGESPGPRRISTGAGLTIKDLYRLFPKGPGKLVALIAGVPKPKSCL